MVEITNAIEDAMSDITNAKLRIINDEKRKILIKKVIYLYKQYEYEYVSEYKCISTYMIYVYTNIHAISLQELIVVAEKLKDRQGAFLDFTHQYEKSVKESKRIKLFNSFDTEDKGGSVGSAMTPRTPGSTVRPQRRGSLSKRR
jgi:hypothetical protein